MTLTVDAIPATTDDSHPGVSPGWKIMKRHYGVDMRKIIDNMKKRVKKK